MSCTNAGRACLEVLYAHSFLVVRYGYLACRKHWASLPVWEPEVVVEVAVKEWAREVVIA